MFKFFLIIFLSVLLIVVLFSSFFFFSFPSNSYYAVYTITGDIYFGKLSYFPRLSLSDVYLLQIPKNGEKISSPVLLRFSDALWGPEDKIYLNEKNIIWKTKVSDKNKLFSLLVNQNQ